VRKHRPIENRLHRLTTFTICVSQFVLLHVDCTNSKDPILMLEWWLRPWFPQSPVTGQRRTTLRSSIKWSLRSILPRGNRCQAPAAEANIAMHAHLKRAAPIGLYRLRTRKPWVWNCGVDLAACQKLLKLANVFRSYSKNNTGTVFLDTCSSGLHYCYLK